MNHTSRVHDAVLTPEPAPASAVPVRAAGGRATRGVVVTAGDAQGLGVLRTLGRKGIPTVMLDWDHCVGMYSRFKQRFFRSPHPSQEQAYVQFLIRLAEEQNLQDWILCPSSDDVIFVLSRNKEALSRYYTVPTPGWDVMQNIHVKRNTYRIALENQIPHPHTYLAGSLEELLAMDIRYPVVLKPSIRDNFYSKTHIKAFGADNREELERHYQFMRQYIDPEEILVQERIKTQRPLNLYSVGTYFKDGEHQACLTVARRRQHPMDFGHATTFAEVVDEPVLIERSRQFLRLLGYRGVAEVEFMKDLETGEFKLLEVNPRVFGWHTLAIAAGVDLPYYLYQDMVGEKIVPQTPVHGLKWFRTLTDLPTVALEVMHGRMALGEYVHTLRGRKTLSVFALDDPLPSLAEVAMIPYLWLKRGF